MRWALEDPGHVALRRSIRTTVGVSAAMLIGLRYMPGSPGIVLAAFGSFALLAFADFGGTLRRRLAALLLSGLAGTALIVIGVLAAGPTWRVAVTTFVVTATLAYLVVLRGAFANAAPALTVVYVVSVMVATSTNELGAMMTGWALAVGLAIPITLFLVPRRTPAVVRRACAQAMRALADHERQRAAQAPRDVPSLDTALATLRDTYLGNPFRSTGVRRGDRALVTLVGQLLTLLAATRREAAQPRPLSTLDGTREFIEDTAQCLDDLADSLLENSADEPTGRTVTRDWLDQWDLAVAHVQHATAADAEQRLRSVAHAFPDRAMAVAVIRMSILVRRIRGLPDENFETDGHTIPEPPDFVPWRALRTQFSLKSPWFRTAMRTGVALAIAAAAVQVLGLAHGFWVLLGVVATLRQDSLATLRTALIAVGGTFAGALIGAGILLLAQGDEPVVVALFVITAFLAVLAQGTVPFAVAQAIFSLYVVLTFSIVSWPPDLSTATDRVLDIAVGAGISLLTAFLLWPRGVVAGLALNVLDAIDRARAVLDQAVAQFLHGAGRGQPPPDLGPMRVAMARSQEVVETQLGSHDPRALARAALWQEVIDDLRSLAVTGSLIATWAGDRPPLDEVVPELLEPIRDDCAAASREWAAVHSILAHDGGLDSAKFEPIVARTLENVSTADLHEEIVADRVVGSIWAHGWLSLTYRAALAARQPAEALA